MEKMYKLSVEVENNFHQTKTWMTVDGNTSTVAAEEVDRVAQQLCGIDECRCRNVPISGNNVIDITGKSWEIV